MREDEKVDSLYRKSPFYQHFNRKMVEATEDLDREYNDQDDRRLNEYLAEEFLDYALKHWMPFAVMWSAIDLDMIDNTISRITNAYVESSNKFLKDNVFKGTRNSSIADRVRQLEAHSKDNVHFVNLDVNLKGAKAARLKAKYAENVQHPRKSTASKKSAIKPKNLPIDKVDDEEAEINVVESWEKKVNLRLKEIDLVMVMLLISKE